MWREASSWVHLPWILCLLHDAPHPPFLGASVVMIREGECKWTGRQFHRRTLTIHHCISDLASDDKISFLLKLLVLPIAWWMSAWIALLKVGAGRTAWRQELIFPWRLAKDLAIRDLIDKIAWHDSIRPKTFGSGRNTFIWIKSRIRPRNSICWVGSKIDFFIFIVNPSSCNSVITFFAFWRQSDLVLPKIRRSSKYITQRITRFCRIWTRISFVIFVNTRGLRSSPKGRTQ